jgi:3-dehydroquinate dehydratase II
MRKVLVLNGPNLAQLGSREPDVYGTTNYVDLVSAITAEGVSLGIETDVRQTNDEAELIGWLHEALENQLDVVLNPAAFTHYSYALRDAASMLTKSGRKLIEVHISNPNAREEFRHSSVIAGVATGTIAGLGTNSYLLALRFLAD